MSTANLKVFITKYANPMTNKLAINTIAQYGGWEAFKDAYADVCETGISTGVTGWTSQNEVVDFFNDNKDDILDYAQSMVDDIGYESLEHMVGMFVFLKGAYSEKTIGEALENSRHSSRDVIANAMGWFVAEDLARSYESLVIDGSWSTKVTSNADS